MRRGIHRVGAEIIRGIRPSHSRSEYQGGVDRPCSLCSITRMRAQPARMTVSGPKSVIRRCRLNVRFATREQTQIDISSYFSREHLLEQVTVAMLLIWIAVTHQSHVLGPAELLQQTKRK